MWNVIGLSAVFSNGLVYAPQQQQKQHYII